MKRRLWSRREKRREWLGEFGCDCGLVTGTSHVLVPAEAASWTSFGVGTDDSGKYSEKKDVDLFEVDTVGDVEGK